MRGSIRYWWWRRQRRKRALAEMRADIDKVLFGRADGREAMIRCANKAYAYGMTWREFERGMRKVFAQRPDLKAFADREWVPFL